VTALRLPICGRPRSALGWRRIVCSNAVAAYLPSSACRPAPFEQVARSALCQYSDEDEAGSLRQPLPADGAPWPGQLHTHLRGSLDELARVPCPAIEWLAMGAGALCFLSSWIDSSTSAAPKAPSYSEAVP
jgi:hypothetical protein